MKSKLNVKKEIKKNCDSPCNISWKNKKRVMEALNQTGVSYWLTNLLIKELGYELGKQEFWDAIKIRDQIYLIEFQLDVWNIIWCNTCSILQERWFLQVKTQWSMRYNFTALVWSMRLCEKGNNSSWSQYEDLPQETNKSKKPVPISVHSISGRLVNEYFLT